MSSLLGQNLPSELRHSRFVFCLRRLAAARSKVVLPHAGALLTQWPDETQDVANYLLAVVEENPKEVAAACQFALTNATYMTDWQRAWVLRVLSRCGLNVASGMLDLLEAEIGSDNSGWLPRIESMRVLASTGRLKEPVVNQVYGRAGRAFQADLVGVVAAHEPAFEWATSFLTAAETDPLLRVIVAAVREKRKTVQSSATI